MPMTTLADLRARDKRSRTSDTRASRASLSRHAAFNSSKHNNNNTYTQPKPTSNWLLYAIFAVVAFYSIRSFTDTINLSGSYCTRDMTNIATNSSAASEWTKIKAWDNIVSDCTANAPTSTGFADRSGFEGHVDISFVGETRCATTAYALVNYFCQSDAIAGRKHMINFDFVAAAAAAEQDENDILHNTQELGTTGTAGDINTKEEDINKEDEEKVLSKLDAFMYLITSGMLDGYESVFRLYMTQNFDADRLGHVWVLHSNGDATYQWYQSFIKKYTLKQWMQHEDSQRKRSNGNDVLSEKQLFERLEKIRLIVSSDVWSEQVNQAYMDLFMVDMQHLMGKAMTPSIFGKGGGYDDSIEFSWSWECSNGLNNQTVLEKVWQNNNKKESTVESSVSE